MKTFFFIWFKNGFNLITLISIKTIDIHSKAKAYLIFYISTVYSISMNKIGNPGINSISKKNEYFHSEFHSYLYG